MFNSRRFELGFEMAQAPLWHVFSPKFYDVIMSDEAYGFYKQHAAPEELAAHDAYVVERLTPNQASKELLLTSEVMSILRSNQVINKQRFVRKEH